ncbi:MULTISPECIES: ketose-bisphosphate aldolase [Mammaliicoccus]|uniref:ketose-bisphosphate aldolase n=1 Tax=Mammaliicoccus TaxID=2803850 RepID=UPI001EFBA9ED|nr:MULTISPECIES: ketose-bisphosphate aldolase [Mammaliicoccus]WHI54529.1 ketose-bisphosphate aldolase [Mammaliicoccus lentus]WHI57051.1 ketose-bisphosphate aldolase [Mammaliicoccus lentus]WHI64897.1 ketose-bisphosphate aldolase [Mammaliicoccus lentus]WHI85789.1 ketose-bisphosphate aldolase [Mammaliicoccus lentus]WHI90298.1 ketose-bisphosphate aldolase [Mammaliicoccus lentus]
MLYNMKDLLKVANEHKFAVPAFNISSFDMLKSIMEEVERLECPVILEIHPDEIEYLGNNFVSIVRAYALNSKVPVVIHLDHGSTLFDVTRAIRNGYTSVMIDASTQSFEDNISITKQIVELAHNVDVSVEAELGTIGNNASTEGGTDEIIYTDPDQADYFVKETNIDTLAVAIGTSHGLYPKGKKPELNIELLKEINSRLSIPIVLHGGSGNPDEEVRESVLYGVGKVNLSSDLKSVFFEQVRQTLIDNKNMYEPNEVYPEANKKLKKVVEYKMNLLNTIGKAKLYK